MPSVADESSPDGVDEAKEAEVVEEKLSA